MKHIITTFFALLVLGCTSVPNGITPVGDFELNRYLGTWYEIARLDHGFERNLSNVSATYGLNDDGSVSVLNRGFNTQNADWESIEGKASFAEQDDVGFLKVSFFGPFYASYVIFELDKEGYQYALVCGPNRNYFWILSRTKEMDEAVQSALLEAAEANGFDTSALIWVDQSMEQSLNF